VKSKLIAKCAAFTFVLAAILFGCAGRLDWHVAWVFVATVSALATATALTIATRDPDLLAERSGFHHSTKVWDRGSLRSWPWWGRGPCRSWLDWTRASGGRLRCRKGLLREESLRESMKHLTGVDVTVYEKNTKMLRGVRTMPQMKRIKGDDSPCEPRRSEVGKMTEEEREDHLDCCVATEAIEEALEKGGMKRTRDFAKELGLEI
jgi:hypothetical protein